MTSQQVREIIARQPLAQLQIIVAALVMGCVFFAVVVLLLNPPLDLRLADSQQPLTYVLLAFAVPTLVARAVVPGAIVSAGVRRLASSAKDETDPTARVEALAALLQTRTIVAGALIEGVTFFALVVYMVDSSPVALLLAAILIAALAMHIPTRSWAEGWIEARLQSIEHEQQFGR